STAASAPSGGVVVAMPVKPDTNGPKNVSDATTSGAEDADRTMELPATVLRPTGAAQTRIPGQPSGGESENGRSAQPNDGDSAGTSDAPSDGKSPGRPIELSRDGLPRRVRQNRTRRPGPTSARATGGESAAARSPEQIRAAMSALQAGTMRGRRDAAAIPAAATPHVDVPDARPGDVTESGRNE
ncbi:MAG TPA: hypothetical protein VF174_00095, partial [Micromonosporaceae bacterium]